VHAGAEAGRVVDVRHGADRAVLLLSVALQLALGLVFGHDFDTRGFMAAGYLVGTGGNPYAASDLSAVFHHVRFDKLGPAGYPPPWLLALGLLYLISYAVIPNLLLYNLVLKLPVIAANVGLAYLVAAILKELGASPAVARRAWILMLFNPVLLYFGAAWGQIDAIAAALAIWALTLLWARRTTASAALMALSICVKPIALPVAPMSLSYLWWRGPWHALRYAGVLAVTGIGLYVMPFILLEWDPSSVLHRWNGHFTLTGGLALSTAFRLWRDPLELPGWWWLVGLAWIPALAAAMLALRRGDGGLEDLLKKTTGLVLVYFLTRARLAEPDLVLLVPLVLVLTGTGALPRWTFLAVCVIPLAFSVVNHSPLDLLFPAFPGTMESSLRWVDQYEETALVLKAALAVAWQVTGWWMVVTCLRRAPSQATLRAPDEALEAVVGR
jgi:Glycosyltransferase family 87